MLTGKSIDPREFQKAVRTYYQMMGWDDNGVPRRSKLEELDLEWVSEIS